jgi:hypothetical protein
MFAAVQSSALCSIGARPCASGGLAAERSRLLSRTLPVGDWQTNSARFCLAVDAGCRFTRGRFDGNVAPCCRSIARYAVVGQAKTARPFTYSPAFQRARMKCSG